MIRAHGKPMTFDEMRSGKPCGAALERSCRRALHTMVASGALIALGEGGRGDPRRYFLNPILIGMMGETPETDALVAALQADPGTEEACRRLTRITAMEGSHHEQA